MSRELNEPRLSLGRAFEVLVSHRNEISKVATKENISSIWTLEYKRTAEDRANLRHQSESTTSSLGRDGAGTETSVGFVGS